MPQTTIVAVGGLLTALVSAIGGYLLKRDKLKADSSRKTSQVKAQSKSQEVKEEATIATLIGSVKDYREWLAQERADRKADQARADDRANKIIEAYKKLEAEKNALQAELTAIYKRNDP